MNRRLGTGGFLLTALLVAAALLLATAWFNYRADRWGIFAADYQTFNGMARPNRHWLKTRFLATTDSDYDCLIMGSSRVGSLDPRRAPGHCYNFWHSGGLPANHLQALRTLIDSGVTLKRVYLGLDDISWFWNPEDNRSHYLRRGYPVDWQDRFAGMVFYLFTPMTLDDLGNALGSVPKQVQPEVILDTAKDWERIDAESREMFAAPVAQDKRFRGINATLSARMSGSGYRGEAAAAEVAAFLELARAHGIEVTLFFNPLHYKTYLTRDYPYVLDFKRRIAALQGFHDFTGLNRYSSDNRYWKEASHYTSLVGETMLDVMVDGAAPAEGFGEFVTSATLARREGQQLQRDLAYLPELLRKEGLLQVPLRFYAALQQRGALLRAPVRQPSDVGNTALVAGGAIQVERGDAARLRRPGIWTGLPEGSLFILRYSLESAERSRLLFNLRWGPDGYGGGNWRDLRVIILPGLNEGFVAGYASLANPPLRVHLANGDVHQQWQPLELDLIDSAAVQTSRTP
ncbi:hypothetical protein [Haliea sp. E17]|uniref:hypothetical protein n=1 Tax=Haliea sp. E17 TaxID=3401576 RepID=UPI003AB0BE7C